MRFPTSRKSIRSGRVAGLLALSSALFSSVTAADPCQDIYNYKKDSGGFFPSSMAIACLKALPLNTEYAKQTADGLLPIHELVSYQVYYKKPPTPELEIPPHDGVAEIKKIQENLNKGHYKGLYDFSTDVYKVFMNYRDGHTQLNPLINYIFSYAHPYSIVSVADSPTSKPKVWTLDTDRKLNKEVTKINGEPVAEYLSALANSTLESFGFTDPDTRYNMLFAQFPTVAPQENMGYFTYVSQYPGADKFTFTFADGSEEEVEWYARIVDDSHLPLFKAGAKEVASLGWVSDEDWETMTRQWTEEEATQFAIQSGWQIPNITSSNQETKHKKKPGNAVTHHKHSTAKHHPDLTFSEHYYPNGASRKKPHKRDVEAMKKLLRKLKQRSEDYDDDYDEEDDDYDQDVDDVDDDDVDVDDDVDDDDVDDDVVDDDEDYDEDYDEEEPTATNTHTPTHTGTHTPTHTPTHIPTDDDDTYDDTPDTSGQDPGFPEYFNTTKDGKFRFYSLDGETAVLDVSSFGVDDIVEASDLVDYGLDYIHSTGHKYLIIDLTNNGGGAAFLPFDLTRQIFPDTWKFESVNMRYTKAGYVMLKNSPLSMYWTVEGKDWNSLEDLYTPVKRDGDEFTQMFKYDHLEITEQGGYGKDPTQKQYFSKDNIVVVCNGFCGSACFAWFESLDRQGVRSYAMGGRPNGSKYMQTSGGVKGGVLFSVEQFTQLKSFYSAFDDEEAQKIAKVLPGPLRLNLQYNGLNVENQFRNGEEDQLPLEFRYNPACKRFSWTKEMMDDTGYTWKFIREQAWDKNGKPTGCEKAYVPEQPYKPETDSKKKGSQHAYDRIPPHPPKKSHADVTPTKPKGKPKHGNAKPKNPHAKEHKLPYPDYPPVSGEHHKGRVATKHKPKVHN